MSKTPSVVEGPDAGWLGDDYRRARTHVSAPLTVWVYGRVGVWVKAIADDELRIGNCEQLSRVRLRG